MTSLANKKVSEIMKLKGVKVRPGKYSVLEGTDQPLSFEKSAYLKLYEGLSDPELKTVTFDSFLPFLFLFFISKICREIENRYIKLHETIGIIHHSNFSLLSLFLKHGVRVDSLNSKNISYIMVEKVVIEYLNIHYQTPTFEDTDTIIQKIKSHMKTDYVTNIELQKQSFINEKPSLTNIEFGRWLAYIINLQMTLSSMKDTNAKLRDIDEINTKLLTLNIEKVFWKIVSVIDDFSQEAFTMRIKTKFEEYNDKDMRISDYNNILLGVMKYYISNINIQTIESITFKFFLDLILKSDEVELSKYIEVNDINLVRLSLPLKLFRKIRIVKSGRELLVNYSYYVLSTFSDKLLFHIFLKLCISEFQEKVINKKEEIENYLNSQK